MANVIREDIIKLGWDIDDNPLISLTKEIDELKKKLGGGMGDDAFEDLKESVNESKDSMDDAKNSAQSLTQKLKELGKKGATTAFNALKKLASISFKALAAGITAAATAVGAIIKNAVTAYANYEQLIGGVETLFGDSASTVQKYANDAYKTAGLSANEYMDTVTSFSASLISGLGGDTKKASEYANVAIVDMADNANKMGTDMSSIQNAYQGFAKQNYTIKPNSRAA